MQVSRTETSFADSVAALLETHKPRVFSIVTIDGKQERGYAPVIVGPDFLMCQSGAEERQNQRIYPLGAIVSVTPSG